MLSLKCALAKLRETMVMSYNANAHTDLRYTAYRVDPGVFVNRLITFDSINTIVRIGFVLSR